MLFLHTERNYSLFLIPPTKSSHLFPFASSNRLFITSVLLEEFSRDLLQPIVYLPVTAVRSA